jgi:hypothetical protein
MNPASVVTSGIAVEDSAWRPVSEFGRALYRGGR